MCYWIILESDTSKLVNIHSKVHHYTDEIFDVLINDLSSQLRLCFFWRIRKYLALFFRQLFYP